MSPAAGATAVRERPISPVTQRAVAFVAQHKPAAEDLGRSLAELTGDPEAFARALNEGLATLADPEYLEGQRRIAPGIGDVIGVRWPLIEAVKRGFRESTRGDRTSTWLFVADRLLREPPLEPRWFSFGMLERTIEDEPERTWQLVRRAAREASDWITVDALAHVAGKGILNEAYRWAELEQLVYSPSRWERRLVGSTVATTPFVDHRRGREPIVAANGLNLIRQLIGDDEPDVQKALAWALRSLRPRGPGGRGNLLRRAGGHRRANERRSPRLGHPRRPFQAPRRPRRADQGSTRRDPPPRRSARDVRRGRGGGTLRAGHARPAPTRASAELTNDC